MLSLDGLKKYKKKFDLNLLNLTYGCLTLSALSQCMSIGIGNIFLVLSLLFASIYAYYHFDLVLLRIKEFRNIFLFYLIFLVCLLPSVLFSPDIIDSAGWFVRIYLYRSSPFLIVLLICPQNKYTLLLIFLSLVSFAITSVGGLFLIHEGTWRIRGLFGHQMTLAGFLCLIGPLVFCLMYSKQASVKKYLFYTSTFIFTVIISLLNGTRGAWIALFVCLLITGIWFTFKSKRNILILLILCLSIIISVGSSTRFTERLSTVASTTFSSNADRIEMWKSALRMWRDNPIAGVGYHKYKEVYRTQYAKLDNSKYKYAHPHNNFLYLLADSGLIGFIGFCIFFGYIVCFSLIKLKATGNLYYLLIFTTTLSLQIQGLTEYNFGNQAVIKFYWLLLACYLCLAERNYKKFPI